MQETACFESKALSSQKTWVFTCCSKRTCQLHDVVLQYSLVAAILSEDEDSPGQV